ncbi:MAG: L,D-transpeptidase family protein [Alphaproteobacteria bacterium]
MKRELRNILVYPLPGRPSQARIVAGWLVLPAVLGRSGVTFMKREGDGATPCGRYCVGSLVMRADRPNGQMARGGGLDVRVMRPDDGWCEEPRSGRYNRPVRVESSRVGGSQAGPTDLMWRDDRLYDVVGILDWNIRPRAANLGSAIFLHLTRQTRAPTEGCIALDPGHLRRLLAVTGQKTMFFTGLRPGKGRYRR